jgi:hypothetical protein
MPQRRQPAEPLSYEWQSYSRCNDARHGQPPPRIRFSASAVSADEAAEPAEAWPIAASCTGYAMRYAAASHFYAAAAAAFFEMPADAVTSA